MDTLILFVKAPRPGRVKTRLAAWLGAEPSAELYRGLVEAVLRATGPGAAYRRLVFADGDVGDVQRWLPGEECHPQLGRDLGERMAHAFEAAFAGGARRVVLAGSDVPRLDRARVAGALGALDDADLVLAPAGDGGYSLIGLTAPRPELFAGVAWSTSSVLDQTRRNAAHLRVRLLDTLPDLDTRDDLVAAWPGLRGELPAGTREVVERRLAAPRQD